MRPLIAVVAAVGLGVLGVPAAAKASAAPPEPNHQNGILKTWDASVTRAQVPLLVRSGADAQELGALTGKQAKQVQVELTGTQAALVRAQGVRLVEHRASAAPAAEGVFRPYSGDGGIVQELQRIAAEHPDLAKVESIGKTVRGQDILAVKVTKDANTTADGSRPGTLYLGAQHAREWITTEMTRRLLHHFVDDYGTDSKVTSLVNSTELWFLPVANPDGYDYTFSDTPGARNWRKNLRDNNGDGKITAGDGVDINRNSGFKWGWDNEGSSPDPNAETYRGSGPDSEPETQALNAFEQRVHPRIALNYHSAAQVLLYGVGWQTATPTPDDTLYKALVGDPSRSAVPGSRPQVTSDISTSNGDSAGEAANVNHVLMIADEMASCQTAAASDPDDAWQPEDCASTFAFPDDEKLIQGEFEKNLPLAVSVAESAPHPEQPVSSIGATAAALVPHTFTTSYANGSAQQVSLVARKSLADKKLHYRIDGGAERTEHVAPWKGGSVYGGTDNLYYDEYRGSVTGGQAGDSVDVWFTGVDDGTPVASKHFTYSVARRSAGDVLVLADEGRPAVHTDAYVDALASAGHANAPVWDVAKQGAPDALGTLSHFKAVVWDVAGHTAGAPTTLAVRDYLNEGGKLVEAGSAAGSNEPLNETQVNVDDFGQYWLGADAPTSLSSPTGFTGDGPLSGVTAPFATPPSSARGFVPIDESLPVAQFPQFRSAAAGSYDGVHGPFEPFTGNGFAAALHADDAWMRLTRTVDLTAVTADQAPQLHLALSYDTEPGFDSVVIEAHSAGKDDWTTLPDLNGTMSNSAPDNCVGLVQEHPFLAHYLTPSGQTCTSTGTSGSWHHVTGSSNGWHQTAVDLSAYAGEQVEVSVSYITDGSTGGHGVFVDDSHLDIAGKAADTTDFESGLGPWHAADAPAGSSGNVRNWVASGPVLHLDAAISTPHSLLLGFGLETALASQRANIMATALSNLSPKTTPRRPEVN